MNELLNKINEAVLSGEEEETARYVSEGVNGGIQPRDILEKSMIPAMETIGARFASGDAFIPELIVAAKAMESGMDVLKKSLSSGDMNKGKIMLGTVEGDIHSIGKNLVKMCLEGAGYTVQDLGENIKTAIFVEEYKKIKPDILGLSALLSSTMLHMEEIIKSIKEIDSGARIVIGGAPITKEFADKIGASGYALNAFEAVSMVRGLLK